MQSISERILYEDNHLIVINKLPSELVQADKSGDRCLIDDVRDYLKVKYNKPGNVFVGLVHRIDRPVSGVVLFAKTSKALARMTVKVKERDVRKTYLAIVKNRPPKDADELNDYLWKNEKQNKTYVVDPKKSVGKLSKLSYKVIEHSDSLYLLEIDLYTGRHHQIRSQLSNIGCPIRGDLKYGYPRSNSDASINLHSYRMNFIHPVTKNEITITAPLPDTSPWNIFSKYNEN